MVVAGALALAACGAPGIFNKARDLERKGYFIEACLRYETLVKRHPKHPLAPAALYHLGRIYQKHLKLYSQSSQYYQDLLKAYPAAQPWVSRAMQGAMGSPDFFPLSPGSFWIEGDSQSGGSNMRAEWTCLAVSSTVWAIQRKVFAGKTAVATIKRYYSVNAFALQEKETPSDPRSTVVLSYPYYDGKSWKTVRDGQSVVYTIVTRSATVLTKAGEFTGCLKIREENPRIPGSHRINYYAPGIGWVLTTTATAGGAEHRNTELLSCKIAADEMDATP